jgi:hypothetical protein
LAPTEFGWRDEVSCGENIERIWSADDDAFARNARERGQVEMIHMRMGKKDKIDTGHIPGIQSRADQSFAADGSNANLRANSIKEDGIGEDVNTEEVQKDGGMSNPANVDRLVGPVAKVCRCDLDGLALEIVDIATENSCCERPGIVQPAECTGSDNAGEK